MEIWRNNKREWKIQSEKVLEGRRNKKEFLENEWKMEQELEDKYSGEITME